MNARMDAPLQVTQRASELQNASVFDVSGDLVVTTVEGLEEALAPALEEVGQKLILDLGHLTHIDTPGLAFLYRLARRSVAAGGWLTLAALPARFVPLIEELRLDDELRFRDTVQSALADLSR